MQDEILVNFVLLVENEYSLRFIGKQLFAYLFFAIFSKLVYNIYMNLTVYNPDEPEEPQEGSPIPEVQEEVENIISFSAASPYMSIEEVATIL